MTYRPLRSLLLLTLALLLVTTAQAGKIYKWTDPSGEVHYGQTPPPNKHAQEINVKIDEPKPAADTTADEKSKDATQKQSGTKPVTDKPANKEKSEQQAATEKKNAEIRQENCKRSNQRLRTISAGGRMYDVNDKGERVYWDDAKRASELSDAQQLVDKWCDKE